MKATKANSERHK